MGSDRRPWLIISKREAQAVLPILRDYIEAAPQMKDQRWSQDLLRAERVITAQLDYIEHGAGAEEDITSTLLREHRAPPKPYKERAEATWP